MGFLLVESSRDDMLMPYYNLVKSKGVDVPFGLFKSILLEHLTQNGGLRNLSLASNYYLAGAARYYFNGDLTDNKDLALFHPYTPNSRIEAAVNNGEEVQQNHTDVWKTDVCAVLNRIILVLRNAYIDTLGETFEQPEDFGKLSIKQLFRKYNKKSSSIKDDDENEEEKIDMSNDVGNGYTFDIMYSHEDCKKYYNATNPGAWCITYGQCHYDAYVKRLDIHYVVFRKNGWENVPRKAEKDKWKKDNSYYYPLPQDDYGNSLICVLQSNKNGEPIYITSRWNHGAGDSGSVEADHAYSKEDFMKITGVSQDDLMRIFEIWKLNAGKQTKSRKELSEEFKNVLRKLKEFQMRINTGGNFEENANKFSVSIVKPIVDANGGEQVELTQKIIKKTVCIAKISDGTQFYYFILDKFKVIFDSVSSTNSLLYGEFLTESNYTDSKNAKIKNSIIIPTKTYSLIYNIRLHNFVEINGVKKFKKIPLPEDCQIWNYPDELTWKFYEVKNGMNDVALIDNNTGKPLKLPNGEYWFNLLKNATTAWEPRNKIHSHFVGSEKTPVLEIIYDMSSGEKYFYNCVQKRFIEINPDFDVVLSYSPDTIKPTLANISTRRHSGYENQRKQLFGVTYESNGYYYSNPPTSVFDANTNEKLSIFGLNCFYSFSQHYNCIYNVSVQRLFSSEYNFKNNNKKQFFENIFPKRPFFYDIDINKPLMIDGKFVQQDTTCINSNFLLMQLNNYCDLCIEDLSPQYVIYDVNRHAFIENKSNFPTYYSFIFGGYLNKYEDISKYGFGFYVPNEKVLKSNDLIDVNLDDSDYYNHVSVKKGCIHLTYDNISYIDVQVPDYEAKYQELFGNDDVNVDNQLNEDIYNMVKCVLSNIKSIKQMQN